MFSLCFAKDNDIIADIERSRDVTNRLIDHHLKNLAGIMCAEDQSSVSTEPFVGSKGRNVVTLRG